MALWRSLECRLLWKTLPESLPGSEAQSFFRSHGLRQVLLGFEVLEVVDDELRAWSPSEHFAAVIDLRYSAKGAWIPQSVFNRPIRQVCVLARGMNHNARGQPI